MGVFDFMKPVPGAGRIVPAPELTPKQVHQAELSWRNSWVNDPRSASYFWVALRGDTVLLAEYDSCECEGDDVDPSGHLHKLAELPGKWAPVVVGESLTYDENNSEVRVPVTVPVFAATEDFEPFTLRAVPVTLDHQSLSEIQYEIAPGTEIVWGHRTISNLQAGGDHIADALVFGVTDVKTHTGHISQAYADGSVERHETLESAYGGPLHPALLPPEAKAVTAPES